MFSIQRRQKLAIAYTCNTAGEFIFPGIGWQFLYLIYDIMVGNYKSLMVIVRIQLQVLFMNINILLQSITPSVTDFLRYENQLKIIQLYLH